MDAEYSFAASDYFINLLERIRNSGEIEPLVRDILAFYADLVSEARVSGYSSQVSRAIRYIHSHLYDPLKVQDVAAYLPMDPSAFSRLFSEETGMAPSDYIESKKMDEAQRLLLQRDMTVSQVAEILGYCSCQPFSLRFKLCYQMTPREFRNANQMI